MAYLLITDRKDGSRRRIAIETPTFVIGKKDPCHLVLDRVNISREHCEIAAAAGGHVVRDLKSRNGTFVDGKKISGETALADGAVVQLGDFTLVFRAGSVDGAAAEPKPGPPTPAHRA